MPSSQPSSQPIIYPTSRPTVTPTTGSLLALVNAPDGVVGQFSALSDLSNLFPTQTQVETQSVGSFHRSKKDTKKSISKTRLSDVGTCTINVIVCIYKVFKDPENGDLIFAEPKTEPFSPSYFQMIDKNYGKGISASKILTFELWIKFDMIDNPDNPATVFSFGTADTYISFPAFVSRTKEEAEKFWHIIVIFNFQKGYTKVFLDGSPYNIMKPVVHHGGVTYETNEGGDPSLATVFPSPQTGDARIVLPSTGIFSVGRNIDGSSPALTAHLRDFNVWFGELDLTQILSSVAVGSGSPDTLFLTSLVTNANINVTFYATTKQNTEVLFYGGSSQPGARDGNGFIKDNITFDIFSSETTFTFIPQDPKCLYRATEKLPIRKKMPAMNYTIELKDCNAPAPIFAAGPVACPLGPDVECYCANQPVAPKDYMIRAGLHHQNMTVYNVTKDPLTFRFEYHTGLCFQLVPDNGDIFSTTSGELPPGFPVDGPADDRVACFNNDAFYFEKGGDAKNVTIAAFERYPVGQGSEWYGKTLKTEDIQFNYNVGVGDVEFRVWDMITGTTGTIIKYDSTLVYKNDEDRFGHPTDARYSVVPNNMNTMFPFDYELKVYANRISLDGRLEAVDKTWYIPIAGIQPNKVPNYYPVSSDPNLIFMVLRDPPGGGSSVTIEQGTTASFELAIDGAYTYSSDISGSLTAGLGVEFDSSLCVGLGAAVCSTLLSTKISAEISASAGHSVEASRSSHTAYAYSFGFTSAISTSGDPNLAGHPSDIIIGGGINIVTSEAMRVQHFARDGTNSNCFKFDRTVQWLPGKVSTFVLPVHQIEALTVKLDKLLNRASVQENPTEAAKLAAKAANWATILANYRAHNDELTPIFSAENEQFRGMVMMYQNFLNGGLTQEDVADSLREKMLYRNSRSFTSDYNEAFQAYGTSCDSVIPSHQNKYMRNICDGFSRSKWEDAYSTIMGACSMTNFISRRMRDSNTNSISDLSAEDVSIHRKLLDNPFSNSPLIEGMCKTGTAIDGTEYPGGVEPANNPQQMFGFLSDKNQYLTFSSNSPISMSWSSSISDSMEQSSSFSTNYPYSVGGSLGAELSVAAVSFSLSASLEASFGAAFSIGKTSSNGHEFSRSVSITLDDGDIGDYFTIRITSDPVFGTPVFTTIGGVSKCPGETLTSKAESVATVYVVNHCGPSHDKPCSKQWLTYEEDVAYFGMVIVNNSPTEDLFFGTIGFDNWYDSYYRQEYTDDVNKPGYCGSPNQRGGITATIMETDIQYIPYRVEVVVPFSVKRDFQTGPCLVYNDVKIDLTATCELPGRNSQVYQYDSITDPETNVQTIDYNTVVGYFYLSATFSVEWASARRLESSPDVDGLASNIQSLEKRIEDHNTQHQQRHDEMGIMIQNVVQCFQVVLGLLIVSWGYILFLWFRGPIKSGGTKPVNVDVTQTEKV